MSKHILQQLCEDSDLDVQRYSGRGMFGRDCLGIVTDLSIGVFFAHILSAVVDMGVGTRDEVADEDDDVDTSDADALTELAEAFEGMRQDNMGRGMVYYFPQIQYVESEEEYDDLSEDEEEEEDEDQE